MSGRINPREYDLGELRDAVREASRRDTEPVRSRDRLGFPADSRSNESESGSTAGERSYDEKEEYASTVEDSEAYIRTRHQRERFAAKEPRPNRRGGQSGMGSVQNRDRSRDHSRVASGRNGGFDADFELLAYGSDEEISRPYLEELPGTYGAQVEIFEWLDRLVSKAGREEAISALEYYESIEWVSAESRMKLEDFVDGLRADETTSGSLRISDHRESLVYVTRLADRPRR